MNLDLPMAIRAFEILLGWSLLLQSAEYLRLRALDRVGDWRIQRTEVPNARAVSYTHLTLPTICSV